ncbi:MAG TPA: hypothetical protein VK970_08460, partial [Candidatus Methylacidiphilales bacterium]|nr:hypothetical protein [Candidatus Methylacidiphilales bacterium]
MMTAQPARKAAPKDEPPAESPTASLAGLYGKAYEAERDRLAEIKGISKQLSPPAKGAAAMGPGPGPAPSLDSEQQALAEILLGWVRGAPTLRAALGDLAQAEQKALRQGGGLAPDPQKLAAQLSRKHGARRMSWLAVELLWKLGDDWAGEAPESFAGPDAKSVPGKRLRKLCAVALAGTEATPLHAAILLECLRKETDPIVAEAMRHVIAAHGDKGTKALLASIVSNPSSPLRAADPATVPAARDAWKAASDIVLENYKVDRVDLEEAIRQLNLLVKKHAEPKTGSV